MMYSVSLPARCSLQIIILNYGHAYICRRRLLSMDFWQRLLLSILFFRVLQVLWPIAAPGSCLSDFRLCNFWPRTFLRPVFVGYAQRRARVQNRAVPRQADANDTS